MPTLSLAAYPSLTEKQFEQVAEDLRKKQVVPPRGALLVVVGTTVAREWINPLYEGPAPALLVGIWKSQTDAACFSCPLTPALEAAGVPQGTLWFTSQIDTLKEAIFAGKEYERLVAGEPRPMLVIHTNPDQTREQLDKVMEHLPKRGPGPRGGRDRSVAAAAGLPSGAQLMVSGPPPATPGWMTISIWNSEDDADLFFGTDFIAASQKVGVPTSDKAWLGKITIHTLIRPLSG
jgi:hypothetical protein